MYVIISTLSTFGKKTVSCLVTVSMRGLFHLNKLLKYFKELLREALCGFHASLHAMKQFIRVSVANMIPSFLFSFTCSQYNLQRQMIRI